MPTKSPNDSWPSIVAGRVITGAMVSVAQTFDAFSSWLLAGYAAVLALLLSRLESITHFLSVAAIQKSATLFLVAAGVGLVAKYLASIIISSAHAATLGEQVGSQAISQGASLEPIQISQAVVSATPLPARWLVQFSMRRIEQGQFDGAARLLAQIAMFHSTLIFLEALLILWSGSVLIRGLVA